jgi:hypothetical protein
MDTLKAGDALGFNQSVVSNNGRYTLIMQGDGNLVGYQAGSAFWDTGSWGQPSGTSPVTAAMQTDGNFVLYAPGNVPIWASGTDGNGPDCRLVMQDDRNIVIYRGDGTPIWASNTVYVTGQPVPIEANQEVGSGKRLQVHGQLYRNGSMDASVYSRNDSWVGGLRGRVLVAVVDDGGHQIWVSTVFNAATACSVPDVSCASYRQEVWAEAFPASIGQYANHCDVYCGDAPNYVDLRTKLIEGIKATEDVAQAVKDAWVNLV